MILFGRCSCGCTFESEFFTAEARRGNYITGCEQTCPRCGRNAPVDSSFGGFAVVQQAVRELRSADIYQLDQFRTITRKAANGELTLEEAAEASERLGKNLAQLLREIDPQWVGVLLSIASMALAVALWCADNADDASALEKLEGNRQATVALQYRMDRDAEVDQQLLHTNEMILEELRAARIERAREREKDAPVAAPGVVDLAAARAARVGRP